MATPADQLLKEALDAAVSRNFMTMFEVMMVEKDIDLAMERFTAGLNKLMKREAAVRDVLRKL
jgi:hypothetical protein